MISNEGVGDAVRDGLRGANHSNSLAIARICNDADRPKPRPHTHEEIVNTFLGHLLHQRLGQTRLHCLALGQALAQLKAQAAQLGDAGNDAGLFGEGRERDK